MTVQNLPVAHVNGLALSKSNIEALNNIGNEIATVINDCLPATSAKDQNFQTAITIAIGVSNLRHLFLTSKELKAVVLSMSNNRLGFLTDRTPAIIARNKRTNRYPSVPYSYEELIDPVIEALMKGYRITNNEFNVISGQFYAAKNGLYRQIREYPNLTYFTYNNSNIVYGQDRQIAIVKCWSNWIINGEKFSIGVEAGDELTLQIKVNAGMGDDAVLGKSHSKLFKRILERITGNATPESTDADIINITPTDNGDINDSAENAPGGSIYNAVDESQAVTSETDKTDDDGNENNAQTENNEDDIDKEKEPDFDPLTSEILESYPRKYMPAIKACAESLGIPVKGRVSKAVHTDIKNYDYNDLQDFYNSAFIDHRTNKENAPRFEHACKAAGINYPNSPEQKHLFVFKSAYNEYEGGF